MPSQNQLVFTILKEQGFILYAVSFGQDYTQSSDTSHEAFVGPRNSPKDQLIGTDVRLFQLRSHFGILWTDS